MDSYVLDKREAETESHAMAVAGPPSFPSRRLLFLGSWRDNSAPSNQSVPAVIRDRSEATT
jgi:hypothetical protein